MQYTASTAFLETLSRWGIQVVFGNLGSDHVTFIEAVAEAKASCRKLPNIVGVPHEFVAVSAAHGYFQATGRMAGVLLHVDCGLQNAGGAYHNLFRSRIPAIIFAGLSPLTQEGELRGSRTEYVNWLQDNHNQPGIIRDYSRFTYEFRTGVNVPQVTLRALQMAMSEPRGPVFLFGSREVMAEEIAEPWEKEADVGTISPYLDIKFWQPISPSALLPSAVPELVQLLANAKDPIVVTSHLGQDPKAVDELVKLADLLGLPVADATPFNCNFPFDHSLYVGGFWKGDKQNELLAKADVVLVIESDVPWVASDNKPSPGATIIHIDRDALKRAMPLFYIAAERRYEACPRTALEQLNAEAKSFVSSISESQASAIADRRQRAAAVHAAWQSGLIAEAKTPSIVPGTVCVPHALATLKKVLPSNAFILSETVSNYKPTMNHLAPTDARRYLTSGASSLGWNGGAAVGVSYAIENGLWLDEEAEKPIVVAVCGDGCYLFSVPTSVHTLSSRLSAPIFQVILSNGGWRATKLNTLAMHPKGFASRVSAEDMNVGFGDMATRARYPEVAVAAAGGPTKCWGVRIDRPEELEQAFRTAVQTVKDGRSAVVEVVLPEI